LSKRIRWMWRTLCSLKEALPSEAMAVERLPSEALAKEGLARASATRRFEMGTANIDAAVKQRRADHANADLASRCRVRTRRPRIRPGVRCMVLRPVPSWLAPSSRSSQ